MFFSKKLKKFENIQHCFFSKKNGFSKGLYKSLNCGIGSNDKTIDLSPFNYQIDGDFVEFSTKDPNKDLPKIISKLNKCSIDILEVHTSKSSLEEVFVKLTND